MPEDDDFAELIRRIRRGDAQAAQELIRSYEPAIRREARLRLGALAPAPVRLDGPLPVGAGQLLRASCRRAV